MGILYVVSTPVGNLEDISIRALKTLFSVDFIACEDTRVTGHLLDLLKKRFGSQFQLNDKPKFISYRDINEQRITPFLISQLNHDYSIALVSDAGTPLISDPGYEIVSVCRKKNIPVTIVPGSSAFLIALTGSGIPLQPFTFIGYFPEKQSRRKALFQRLYKSYSIFPSLYVCYISPHKLHTVLQEMITMYGNIQICVAKELTKIHEEYWQGQIIDALLYFKNPKGEFVLLFTFESINDSQEQQLPVPGEKPGAD